MSFNHEFALKLADKALSAAQTGLKLKLDNPNEISQLVLSVFAVGLNAVPVIGSVLGSLTVVLGMALFPAQTVDPWEKLHERVEALIGAKLQAHQVKELQSKIDGLGHNHKTYASVWKQYHEAPPEAKEKLATLLSQVHVAFLFVVRAAIPEFQIDDYAAAALPLFAQAANLHMTLLSDGLKHGLEWGLPKEYIDGTLREEFTSLTSPGNSARGLTALNARTDSIELTMFQEAIDAAEAHGLPAELISTWKEAYTTMIAKVATRADRSNMDYISHVKKYYEEGRKQVKPDDWHKLGHYEGKGTNEGLALQAYSEYDVQMLENVLHYAEFWPYMAGDKEISQESYLKLDREIFRGPYVRYSENVAWSEKSPAPVTKRTEKITSVRLCVAEDVTSLQVKYGETWNKEFGLCRKPELEERIFTLESDEYIENVDLVYGHKLGQLQFVTNKGTVHGPFGKGVHADMKTAVNHTGYALTSIHSTHYERHDPEGIEGVVFGFRPLLTSGN
ncbi:hypothetical protein MY11210_007144 [Beauveria gryllotalpidicola]